MTLSQAARRRCVGRGAEGGLAVCGDDWAEDHHDVEVQDESGRRLAKAKLEEGISGIARLHSMIAEHVGSGDESSKVLIGIETDRGPWVRALAEAGYEVYAINPLQVSRYRERHSVSGAKSDAADAHTLADMVRTDSHQLRMIAGDSDRAGSRLWRGHARPWSGKRNETRSRQFFCALLPSVGSLIQATVGSLAGSGLRYRNLAGLVA